MYNQDYEEYMRSVLGYTPNYQNNTYRDNNYYDSQNQTYFNDRLDNMYPEVYNNLYPLIMREVSMNSRSVTEDMVEEIVDRIYDEYERQQDDRKVETEKADNRNNNISSNNIKSNKDVEKTEDRQRRPRNNLLRDLIKILLLRELLGRPGFPNRPPRPGPGRPPFPGGPGMPPPRPRDYYM